MPIYMCSCNSMFQVKRMKKALHTCTPASMCTPATAKTFKFTMDTGNLDKAKDILIGRYMVGVIKFRNPFHYQ